MSGKPFQSSLIPYQNEIAALRGSRPPVSYACIADLLRQKYGLNIQRAAIAKFVKVRSGRRKIYVLLREVANRKKAQAHTPAPQPGQGGHAPQPVPPNSEQPRSKPRFEFTYSERYNLHRLPPEEAARRQKELEAQGH